VNRVFAPSTDPVLLSAYRFGQVLAVILAGLFASAYGVMPAAAGLMVAVVLLRVVFVVVRGIVFPLIEITSRAVGRALGDN
jgi:hypothetical protein